jgi:hypothetical protein
MSRRALVIAAVLIAAAMAIALMSPAHYPPQSGAPLPSHGEPNLNVAYRETFYCAFPFTVGDTWWEFVEPAKWPPQEPNSSGNIIQPWPVPGTVTFASSTTGTFVADVDRSRLPVVRMPQDAHHTTYGCL